MLVKNFPTLYVYLTKMPLYGLGNLFYQQRGLSQAMTKLMVKSWFPAVGEELLRVTRRDGGVVPLKQTLGPDMVLGSEATFSTSSV